ncbi:hypothetical protein CIB95_11845 [Lottiidibacillus patelloidae]|uniref:protein acetyllysine N-acetyltransferase n=1 Tax=Lottiidibacillus patelloidae TaxID=2670334 RepID=A0A263BRW6_9BACI|nr:Sir2 family NAD-dependent protein deacetylase [Lottiidibacillus patelloidae]OZM56461.1 hypothetical protein CIB95_11845 [Lottiidibacillus patelloidae]
MARTILKVLDDFYDKDIKVGDKVSLFFYRVKILDMEYKNEYGTFIKCKVLPDKLWDEVLDNIDESSDSFEERLMNYDYEDESFDDLEDESSSASPNEYETKAKIQPHPNNPLEIVGTIHIPGYRNLLGGMGFYVKNIETEEIKGYSFGETSWLIQKYGATNAYAYGNLIDTIDELPSLDSQHWKVAAYTDTGELFAPLTDRAKLELKEGFKYAVESKTREYASQFSKNNNYRELDSNALEEVISAINTAKNIVILTGAGISTMSGIPDYRSTVESMWSRQPEYIDKLSENTFNEDPVLFWKHFYDLLKTTLHPIMPFQNHESLLAAMEGISPNDAHRFFRFLEKDLSKNISIITQNVDGLHNKAGNKDIIEFHGRIKECICPQCKKIYLMVDVLKENETPVCNCGEILRPNVVFFGDEVKSPESAEEKVKNADLILVAGTSLQVHPFNALLLSKRNDAKLLLLNNENTNYSQAFDVHLKGNVSTVCRYLRNEMANED